MYNAAGEMSLEKRIRKAMEILEVGARRHVARLAEEAAARKAAEAQGKPVSMNMTGGPANAGGHAEKVASTH